MITIYEWMSIPWEVRLKLFKAFKVGRSGATKVVQVGPGVCVVEDDGVRESDLGCFVGFSIQELRNWESETKPEATEALKETAPVVEKKRATKTTKTTKTAKKK